ncbi:MAG: DUF2914 domain-containing protein [Methylobacter sp.]|nr:DUF2914 domain-containing protein [Methylobacter sp.]
MSDKKNIVIKVKYPKSGKMGENHVSASRMITGWNFKRIWLTIGIAMLVLISLFIFINRNTHEKNTDNIAGSQVTSPVKPEIETAHKNRTITEREALPDTNEIQEKTPQAIEQASSGDNKILDKQKKEAEADNKNIPAISITAKENINNQPEQIKGNEVIKESLDSITNNNVIRAVLAYKINKKEPKGEINSSVKVRKTQATPVYYFTELRKMKGQKLYHQWFRNNKLVFSQELIIYADRWRASSHKLLTYRDKGNWVVKLVNERKQLLNKKDFTVSLVNQ